MKRFCCLTSWGNHASCISWPDSNLTSLAYMKPSRERRMYSVFRKATDKTRRRLIQSFQWFLQSLIYPLHSGGVVKSVRLNSNNWAGQKKNRYVLMYLCLRKLAGKNCDVQLRFVVAGNTKCVVDEAFGHVKRKLKSMDYQTPAEMMNIVCIRSEINIGLSAPDVAYRLW